MKPLLLATLLLVTTTASAQDFRVQSRRSVQFLYYENYGDYGYGYPYGYPRVVPFGRYQQYPVQQQFYPMSWGAIPGYQTNGYFVPYAW